MFDSGLLGFNGETNRGLNWSRAFLEIRRFKKCSRSENVFPVTALSVKIKCLSVIFQALDEFQTVFTRV